MELVLMESSSAHSKRQNLILLLKYIIQMVAWQKKAEMV